MTRRDLLQTAFAAPAMQQARRPNIIVILTDDQGWGDLGCYGAPNIRTPNIDRMASQGMRLTNFYAAPFCGPSRTMLMTGCYAPRISMGFNHGPKSTTGLHPEETTIARMLKGAGYSTMAIGKWHLGHKPQFLPTAHGFDKYYGLPYSNDMWPYHPMMPPSENEHPRMTAARKRAEYTGYAGQGSYYKPDQVFPDLPLMSNTEILELNPDLTKLIPTYTQKALDFISENRQRPFFLYLAHNQPHTPLFPSKRFEGKSRRGLYGDVMEELDWSVGEMLARLKSLGIDDNTLVVYTSDNGPWLPYGIDGGSAGPLRAGKGTTYEGGVRVPGIFRWPGGIPAGQTSAEPALSIDILPTVGRIAGAKLPTRKIDGKDILPMLTTGTKTPHEAIYYFNGTGAGQSPNLQAIRMGPWKLHVRRKDAAFEPTELYDIDSDISERFDRKAVEPTRTRDMLLRAQAFHEEMTREIRPLGQS